MVPHEGQPALWCSWGAAACGPGLHTARAAARGWPRADHLAAQPAPAPAQAWLTRSAARGGLRLAMACNLGRLPPSVLVRRLAACVKAGASCLQPSPTSPKTDGMALNQMACSWCDLPRVKQCWAAQGAACHRGWEGQRAAQVSVKRGRQERRKDHWLLPLFLTAHFSHTRQTVQLSAPIPKCNTPSRAVISCLNSIPDFWLLSSNPNPQS